MKKTLVLVVDRDDDFGVKGKVNTPVIGVNDCLDAATAFGIADPEDSDLNALYAAVSVCLELQEDGHDADVALICGDEKVGHRSDLALVSQLEQVLNEVEPESVVLVGDGAEDEYIYPIISSRAHVDSVKKVYVKQAPGIEGSLYIFTRMMSDPGKRKRFLAPLGLTIMLIASVFLIPGLVLYSDTKDFNTIADMSGSITAFLIGLVILIYAYDFYSKIQSTKSLLKKNLFNHSTKFIFLCLGLSVIMISLLWSFYNFEDLYIESTLGKIVYGAYVMIWPTVMGIIIGILGEVIEDYQINRVVRTRMFTDSISLVSIGLVATGILDILQNYINAHYANDFGIVEIVLGIILSLVLNFYKSRYLSKDVSEEESVVEV